MEFTPMQMVASVIFAIAVAHTFLTKHFERLAHTYPNHAGVFHFLSEVEAVFGFWALVLMLIMAAMAGSHEGRRAHRRALHLRLAVRHECVLGAPPSGRRRRNAA